ncbi:hypothetical protein D3C73_1342650 [compost metagenome]
MYNQFYTAGHAGYSLFNFPFIGQHFNKIAADYAPRLEARHFAIGGFVPIA